MNQDQFLRECGKSYPEAMAALGYFRTSILQQCKPVVQKRIREFAEILGVSAQDLKLTEYIEPDRPLPTVPDKISLGWQAKRSEDLYLYFYLCWTRETVEDSDPLSIVIAIWIKDRKKREELAAKLAQLKEGSPFRDEPWLVTDRRFRMHMQEGEIPQVGDKLDALLAYTFIFLKSLKGIEDYFLA